MRNKIILLITICIMLATTFILYMVVKNKSNINETENWKLQIRESSWSGWSPNYTPNEKTGVYDIEKGKEYSINGGNLSFIITKINSNSIEIKTKTPFSNQEKDIDLRTQNRDFTVYLTKEIRLDEPSMDAGNIYYLKLIKK